MYDKFIERAHNPFKSHWLAFKNKTITLQQLEEVCFAWIIKNENLYRDHLLPTEPRQHPRASNADFKKVMRAWNLACGSMEAENESNAWWLRKAKKFFLNNDYDTGIALFDKYNGEQ